MSGRPRSRMTTSALVTWMSSSAFWPESSHCTSYPSRSRVRTSGNAMSSSSSTIDDSLGHVRIVGRNHYHARTILHITRTCPPSRERAGDVSSRTGRRAPRPARAPRRTGTARRARGSSAPASTSSQATGVATVGPLPAAQGVRRDGGLGAGVLRPVEEDLAGPLGLGHGRGDQLRVLLLELLGDLLGQRRSTRRRAAAAAGRRTGAGPCCRWSPAWRPGPRSASASRTSSATWQHSCSPAGSPGSRSMTSRSALRGRPLRPTVHWCTCSSSAARLTSQVSVARSSTIGKMRVPSLLRRGPRAGGRHLGGAHPRRRAGRGCSSRRSSCPGRRAASGSGSPRGP